MNAEEEFREVIFFLGTTRTLVILEFMAAVT